jgi:hypothetical protein
MAVKLSEAVMEAMSYIDESYLKQSEEETRSVFSWKPLLAFAAVFSLIFAVFINMPKMGSGSAAPAFNGMYEADSTKSEESISDGITDQVLYDEDLLTYLETVGSETLVPVTIETAVTADAAAREDTETAGASDYSGEAEEPETILMSKDEILNFEPEPGITYIFHLQNADDME